LSVVEDIARKSPVIIEMTMSIGVKIACLVNIKPKPRKSTCRDAAPARGGRRGLIGDEDLCLRRRPERGRDDVDLFTEFQLHEQERVEQGRDGSRMI
jgi:hypothetical protein